MAIQLSMIVVITSLAPVIAFRAPEIPAHTAPASAPKTIASTMCRKPFMPWNDEHVRREPGGDRDLAGQVVVGRAHPATASLRPPPVILIPKSSSDASGGISATISPS